MINRLWTGRKPQGGECQLVSPKTLVVVSVPVALGVVTCLKYLGSQPDWALKVRCLWPAQPHPCFVSGQSKLCLGLCLLFMASGCKVTLVCNNMPDANKC